MHKERSLPTGLKLKTSAPKWHPDLFKLVEELVKMIRKCPNGKGFANEDMLGLYKLILEFGLKKKGTTRIRWGNIVQAVAFLSSNYCVPNPKPHQLEMIDMLLFKIEQWKALNIHHSLMAELSVKDKKKAKVAWKFRLINERDLSLMARAEKATKWVPERLDQKKRRKS